MYLAKLLKTKPADYIKHLACSYLAKRYGKSREFFWNNTEERVIGGKYYYIRTDEEGKEQDIGYLFTDYKFACNKEAISQPFDEEWIKLVYSRLINNAPRYVVRYMQDLDRAMHREVASLKEERLAEIERTFEESLITAELERDKKRAILKQDLIHMEENFDNLFNKISLETGYKSKKNNL